MPTDPNKPFTPEDQKKLDEVGAKADELLQEPEPTEDEMSVAVSDEDVKALSEALKISEGGARKILTAAKEDPELKDLSIEDLVQRLMDDPALQMDLMRQGTEDSGDEKPRMMDFGMGSKGTGGPMDMME